jgi:sialidase-1
MKLSFIPILVALVFFQCKEAASVPETDGVLSDVRLVQHKLPLLVGRDENRLLELRLNVSAGKDSVEVNHITVSFTPESNLDCISEVSIWHSEGAKSVKVGTATSIKRTLKIKGSCKVGTGVNSFQLRFNGKAGANLLATFKISRVGISYDGGHFLSVTPEEPHTYRLAQVVRAAGQDGCDTYRIPGLVTTQSGSLIAVYDNRYHNSKDLQEDINIGMSRSTDGGQTWEPMKVIMDMGEWGGLPEELNGVGDPCVLYDPETHTIWVAALWLHGYSKEQMAWWVSRPGMGPEVTGQFMLVKSTDDGLTWSQPENITAQIKDPAWQLLLQGPGRGICTSNGTLVFPAQFKEDIGTKALDGGQYTCHSTIVYSQDHGKTWKIGTGAKSNTTESQVVELTDGRLMLNMRDDRNRMEKGAGNGRAVATTSDWGKTWIMHPSSNSALPESNCMASIISADVTLDGKIRRMLFFSNPSNKTQRTNMTIKASLDEGMTWPENYQLELNEAPGYGYSCLTMIDPGTVGILYEGVKELYFQKVPVTDLVGK